MAVRECDEFLRQYQYPYFDAVDELLFSQVTRIAVNPVDEVLYLMHKRV